MKKLAFILCVMLLPLLLLASANSYLDYLRGIPLPTGNSRGFRINNSIAFTYDMGSWMQETKNIYHYSSEHGWAESLTIYQYNADTSAWEEFMVITFVHDGYGRVTSYEVMVSMMGLTFPAISATALYDSQHRLIHYYLSSYDFGTGLLVPMTRMHLDYTATNISAMYSWQSDSGLEAPVYDKTTFGFDAQGRVIETIGQISVDSLAWENDFRSLTTFHPHDTSNAATMIEYISAVLPSAILVGDLTTPGMPATDISYSWNGTAWEQSYRTISTYNPNDKIANAQEDNWTGAWTPSNKTLWSYDSNGNYTEILEQEYLDGNWASINKTVFAWEQYSAADDPNTPAANSLALNAYPMPFSGSLTLKPTSAKAGMVEIEIFNMKGQLLNSLATLPGESIQWNGLDNKGNKTGNGIYFIKASQKGSSTTSRVIKLK